MRFLGIPMFPGKYLIGWSAGWFIGWLVHWSPGQLAGEPAGRLTGWPVNQLPSSGYVEDFFFVFSFWFPFIGLTGPSGRCRRPFSLRYVESRASSSGYVERLPADDKPGPGRPGWDRNFIKKLFLDRNQTLYTLGFQAAHDTPIFKKSIFWKFI